jgi:hypothetical protein
MIVAGASSGAVDPGIAALLRHGPPIAVPRLGKALGRVDRGRQTHPVAHGEVHGPALDAFELAEGWAGTRVRLLPGQCFGTPEQTNGERKAHCKRLGVFLEADNCLGESGAAVAGPPRLPAYRLGLLSPRFASITAAVIAAAPMTTPAGDTTVL